MQSAMIATEVLTFLQNNALEPTPANYEVGYLLCNESSERVANELKEFIEDRMRIPQEKMDLVSAKLKGRNTASNENQKTEFKMTKELVQQITKKLKDISESTANTTHDFGQDLREHQEEHARTGAGVELDKLLEAMITTTEKAEQKLQEAKSRIDGLEQDLMQATNMAERDALTGLANRRILEKQLKKITDAGASCVVVMADIDHFKSINDRFGHNVGDRVIKKIGQKLEVEMAPGLVARWGGEEFVAILETTKQEAYDICESARMALQNKEWRVRKDDEKIGSVTVSMGIAEMLPGMTGEESIAAADKYLYEAKENGRNQVRGNK